MRRFEMIITRGRGIKENKYFRANNIGSLVGTAKDMMEDDWTIKNIMIVNTVTGEIEIVR